MTKHSGIGFLIFSIVIAAFMVSPLYTHLFRQELEELIVIYGPTRIFLQRVLCGGVLIVNAIIDMVIVKKFGR